MRYLTLGEALVIAEAVTGIEYATLAKASRLELLDSALHAPQAGFGDDDFYPSVEQKAAVLVVRIARNHPLPDGNKRLAWQSLTIFLALNGYVSRDDRRRSGRPDARHRCRRDRRGGSRAVDPGADRADTLTSTFTPVRCVSARA